MDESIDYQPGEFARAADLTNKRFGKLISVARVANGSGGRAQWYCVCDCGNNKIVLAQSLKTGSTKSCGCVTRGRVAGIPNAPRYNGTNGYMVSVMVGQQTGPGPVKANGKHSISRTCVMVITNSQGLPIEAFEPKPRSQGPTPANIPGYARAMHWLYANGHIGEQGPQGLGVWARREGVTFAKLRGTEDDLLKSYENACKLIAHYQATREGEPVDSMNPRDPDSSIYDPSYDDEEAN